MARQIAPRQVGQRQRDHQREIAAKLALELFHRHDRGLAIERVEHGFDKDEIGPALDQRAALVDIDRDDFVEGNFAKTRVLDIGRQRQRLVGRPHRPRDKARYAIGARVDRLADDTRCGDIDLMDQVLCPVIRLADPVGVEGVGGEDMRACIDIAVADRPDHLRLGQVDEVVIALLVLLQRGARSIVFRP